MDLSDKSSECDDSSCLTRTSDRVASDASNVKSCVDCGTSKTPLWRGGPAGPKSLCNACGIKSRKKRRALVGVTAEDCDARTTNKSTASINDHINNIHSRSDSCTSSSGDSTTNACSVKEKKRMLWCSFGRSLQRPRSNSNRRRKMKEEEEAAFLLMALSSGSVCA